MNTDPIAYLRFIARQAHDAPGVIKYVHQTLLQLVELMRVLGLQDDEIYRRLHLGKEDSAGSVAFDDVKDVINDGNLRERMTAILTFVERSYDLYAKMMHMKLSNDPLPDYLNVNFLVELIERTKDAMALNESVLKERLGLCIGTECTHTRLVLIPKSSPLIASRINGFPMRGSPLRVPREVQMQEHEVKQTDVYPELSDREKKFMGIQSKDTKNPLPWVTGYNYFEVKADSVYAKLLNDQQLIAGISGGSDMLMDAFKLFNNFDGVLATLACVAYMGNPPDHSCVEILLSTNTHCDEYNYTSDKNANVFILNLIKGLSGSQQQQSSSGKKQELYKLTTKKFVIPGQRKERNVYVNNKVKYILMKGKYVRISSIIKNFTKLIH